MINIGRDESNHDRLVRDMGVPDRHEVEVLIFGHSFISHLEKFTWNNGPKFAKMGFQNPRINVHFHGVPGATIRVLREKHLDVVKKLRPEVIYVQIGTIDLCDRTRGPEVIGSEMHDLALILRRLGVRRIVFGQVLFRDEEGKPTGMQHFNGRVVVLNNYLDAVLGDEYAVRFWRHRGFWRDIESNVKDGTHLNPWGQKKFFRSVRGAILVTLKEIRPALFM